MAHNGGGMKSCRLRRIAFSRHQEVGAAQNVSNRIATAIFYNACYGLPFFKI